MSRGCLFAVALSTVAFVGAGCGEDATDSKKRDSADSQGFTEADAERWLTRYAKKVMAFKEQAEKAEAPAKRGDFATVGRIVKKLGREGGHVRNEFAAVPTNLRNGEQLYRMLIVAGDAATEWALIYRTDPPPYGQTTAGLRKGQQLADAAVNFQRKLNRVYRFLDAHADEPVTR